MYRCWTGYRSIGGKMLKNLVILTSLFFCVSASACWKLEGSVGIDGETYKLNQKVDHDKEYIVPMGTFIFKMTVSISKENKNLKNMKYVVQEKKGTNLILVTMGEEEDIEVGKTKEIYAKGEEGQPHTVMTIKLTDI